jgi:putative phosphoesterase
VPLGVVGAVGFVGAGGSLTAVRVAVLSDIHGNMPALEAVLADVDGAGVDAVLVAGDVIGGAFPAEVVDRLMSLPDVRIVRGNADRFVLEGTDEYGEDWQAERERMGAARLDVVASWPLTHELEIGGLGRTLVCHAIPTADEPIFTRITPDEDVAALLGDLDADLVVVGHTHMQFDRRLPSGLRIVNGGSVGLPYEGRRGAFGAILGPEVDMRHTEYDVEAAVASMRSSGAPRPEEQLNLLLEPPSSDETSRFFESQRGT